MQNKTARAFSFRLLAEIGHGMLDILKRPIRECRTLQRQFPRYTLAEQRVDRAIHGVGLLSAVVASGWLLVSIGPGAPIRKIGSALVYTIGLVGMLSTSSLYNFVRPGLLKEVLRRIDHSMIFVMIAGSYTPFALNALDPAAGIPLCATIWIMASIGVALKCTQPYRFERLSLALYLGMGWLILGFIRSLAKALTGEGLALLIGGGIVYSLGSIVHTRSRMRFHNAIWHAMVLVAAGLHLVAVAQLFSNGR